MIAGLYIWQSVKTFLWNAALTYEWDFLFAVDWLSSNSNLSALLQSMYLTHLSTYCPCMQAE